MDGKIFHKISYGLYVIGAVKDGVYNGQIANTVFRFPLSCYHCHWH